MTYPNLLTTPDIAPNRHAPLGAARTHFPDPRLFVCLSLLALLILWIKLFPQTGDGDAIMHFINAHDGLWQPDKLLGSWSRFGAKLPLLLPRSLASSPLGALPRSSPSPAPGRPSAWQKTSVSATPGSPRLS